MKIVFDLDGTLADSTERAQRFLIDPPKKDWKGFNEAAFHDKPLWQTVDIFKQMIEAGHIVEIWTGRGAEVYVETIDWLTKHTSVQHMVSLNVRMRPIGDHLHDDDLKKEWSEQFGKPDLVFEDRQRVVDMWRSIGVVCYQVAPGDF